MTAFNGKRQLVRANFEREPASLRVRWHLLRLYLTGAILMTVGAVLCGRAFPTNADPSTSPVLVELFTSEGCSSCPPADDLLRKMDATQPVAGAQLIVLSEHVDYWDHDGWKDPYSSASLTERQSAYVRALGLNTPFTPQLLIDGNVELKGSPDEVAQVLQKAAATPKVPIRIVSAAIEAKTPAIVRGHIEADPNFGKHNTDIYVAVALDHAESQVSRGENQGHQLSHVAVVMEIAKVGKLEKGKTFSQDFQVKVKLPRADPMNIRIVAFVQESGPGKVLGAALKKVAID
jgi:hypothetical protein